MRTQRESSHAPLPPEAVDNLAARASRRPLEGRSLLSPSGIVVDLKVKSSVSPEEPPPEERSVSKGFGGVSKGSFAEDRHSPESDEP
jgi:hypothetical protein